MHKKHACPLPFNHMAVRPDGKIFPCCIFRWDADVPEDLNIYHKDPFNHPYMKELREKMKRDEYIDGCSQCYKDEETKGESYRTQVYEDSEMFGLHSYANNTEPEITNLDLSISNTCNNKCRMCSPALSTQWYSDAKELGWWEVPKGITVNPFIENGDFSKLRYLKLLGGEPLLEQEKIIKILEQCDLEKLRINLITNTSVTPNEKLAEMFKKCKKVRVSLSIDSYGKLNEFLRKGSKWETTVSTMDWFQDRGYDLSVHSVASLYNCNVLMDLIDYCKNRNLPQRYVLADGPSTMMPRSLPTHVKQAITKQLEPHVDVQGIFKVMIDELSKDGEYHRFQHFDKHLNRLRNEHWAEYNPALYDLLRETHES